MAFHRRRFLVAGAIAAAGTLAGCGSSDSQSFTNFASNAPASPPNSTPKNGSLDTTQIGGSNLRIPSVFGPFAPVENGQFNAQVSPNSPQVLLIQDGLQKLRGLILAMPGQPLRGDARSTALGLLFLTPGVSTVDLTEAATVIERATALPAFTALVNFLSSRLPGTDLGALAQDSQFLSLLDSLVTALRATLSPKATGSSGFLAAKVDQGHIQIDNTAPRFVAVVRQNLDGSGHELAHAAPVLTANNPLPSAASNLVSGVNLLSWGNLLTGQVDQPGQATDPFSPAGNPTVKSLDYWNIGLGSLEGAPLPATISAAEFNTTIADLASILFYALGPIIDVLGAAGEWLSSLPKMLEVAIAVAGAGFNKAALVGAFNSQDIGNIRAGCIDLAAATVGVLAAAGVGGFSVPAIAAVGLLSAAAGAINFTIFLAQLAITPRIARASVSLQKVPSYTSQRLPLPIPPSPGVSHNGLPFSITADGKVFFEDVRTNTDSFGANTGGSIELGVFLNPSSDLFELHSYAVPTPLSLTQSLLPFSGGGNGNRMMNANGDVVYGIIVEHFAGGNYLFQNSFGRVRLTGGITTDIPPLAGASDLVACSISDSGEVVGVSGGEGFRYRNGIVFSLGLRAALGLTVVSQVWGNDNGQIAGYGQTNQGPRAFFRDGDNPPVFVDDLLATVTGIADDGTVLYVLGTDGSVRVWKNGTSSEVTMPPLGPVTIVSMNRKGQMVGWTKIAGGNQVYLWLEPSSPVLLTGIPDDFVPAVLGDSLHIAGSGASEIIHNPSGQSNVWTTNPIYLLTPQA